jgi:hypothetical protein
MRDTSPEMERQFVEMMMRRSGQERLKMGFSMFNMARRQVVASIKMSKPKADGKEIRKDLFLRFYGEDFPLETQEKIFRQIERISEEPKF